MGLRARSLRGAGVVDHVQRHAHGIIRRTAAPISIEDVEALRAHYALTLRAWLGRLERRSARALEYVNEDTFQAWRLYMTACATGFELGNIGIYQILARKRGAKTACLPLTRRHVYSDLES